MSGGRRVAWRFGGRVLASLLAIDAAHAELRVETWRSDAGLPNQTVTSITQTTDGYIWVGTMNGLARFDGASFRVFNKTTNPELGDSAISQIERRHAGGLWISTMSGRLVRMEGDTFFPEPGAALTGSSPGAEILAEEEDGTLWITVRDGRLARWKQGGLTVMSSAWRASSGKMQARISRDGVVFINGGLRNGSGISRLVNGELVPLGCGFNPGWNYHAPGVDGEVWVSDDKVVRRWREGRWIGAGAPIGWQGSPLNFGIETRDGSLWLATVGGGVLRYATDGSVEKVGRRNGMGGERVNQLFEDRSGGVWVATDGAGLSRIRPALFTSALTKALAPAARVTTLAPAVDGNGIWAGTDGDGLLRIHADGRESEGLAAGTVADGEICSALEASPGELFIGTLSQGWHFARGRESGRIGGFPGGDEPVRACFQDSRRRIWLGGKSPGGLMFLTPDSSHGTAGLKFGHVSQGAEAGVMDVRCFAEDVDGGVWAGCDAGGIFRIDPSGNAKHFTLRDGLAEDNVWSLLATADGCVWIGHAGSGITRWKNGVFTVCGQDRGFPEKVIYGMADGGDGAMWVAGGKGLWRVSFDEINRCCDGFSPTVRTARFGPGDGLPKDGLAATEGGVLRTNDGKLWFATNRGIWITTPGAYHPDPVPPIVAIEGVSVDGKLRFPSSGGLHVDHRARHFEFSYSGLSLSHPSLVAFRCKLDGLDSDWHDAFGARSASYSGLPPGEYVFRVNARNRDHVWAERGASVSFVIHPPWWRRPWLLVLAFLATAGAAVAITRLIVKRRASRKTEEWRRRHEVEVERGRIARDIHDQLGSGLTEIALLGDFLVSHRNCPPETQEISSRARELARAMDETVWAVNPTKDTVDGLISYLAHAMSVWLKYSAIRHRLDLPTTPDLRPLSGECRNHLYLACKEAVHNAIKHSGAAEIRLSVRTGTDRLEITIGDDGCGFDHAEARAGGNGLANIHFRLAKTGGSANISSSPGSGTVISLSVPLPNIP